MAFPLDILPVMSQVTELREKAQNEDTTLRKETASVAHPSLPLLQPYEFLGPSISPVGNFGKMWIKVKGRLRLRHQARERANKTHSQAVLWSTDRLYARDMRNVHRGGDEQVCNNTIPRENSPSSQSNSASEIAEDASTHNESQIEDIEESKVPSGTQDSEIPGPIPSHDITATSVADVIHWQDDEITALPPMSMKPSIEGPAKRGTKKLTKRKRGSGSLTAA